MKGIPLLTDTTIPAQLLKCYKHSIAELANIREKSNKNTHHLSLQNHTSPCSQPYTLQIYLFNLIQEQDNIHTVILRLIQTTKDSYKYICTNLFQEQQHNGTSYLYNALHQTVSESRSQYLADRRKDARLVMLYKIDRELVAINKENRLIPPGRKTRQAHNRSFLPY